jgi:hypothetical protein
VIGVRWISGGWYGSLASDHLELDVAEEVEDLEVECFVAIRNLALLHGASLSRGGRHRAASSEAGGAVLPHGAWSLAAAGGLSGALP